MFTKRIISFLLVAVLMLSMTACSKTPVETTPAETTPVETTVPVPKPEGAVTFFSMNYGQNANSMDYISVYTNEDGSAHVEYVGQERKVTDLDASALDSISAAFLQTGLPELHGQSVYGEGEAYGSMYVSFTSGENVTCDFSGSIPDAFASGWETMDQFFQDLLKDVAEYIPEPMITGNVDATILAELKQILEAGSFQNLDSYSIASIPADEYFSFSVGLTDAEGLTAAANLVPMMMTTAYSLVMVSLEDEADAEAVSQDFMNNLDWRKWVCVAPSNALTARKGNLVLCLMASDELLTRTQNGLDASGWEILSTQTNPDME